MQLSNPNYSDIPTSRKQRQIAISIRRAMLNFMSANAVCSCLFQFSSPSWSHSETLCFFITLLLIALLVEVFNIYLKYNVVMALIYGMYYIIIIIIYN